MNYEQQTELRERIARHDADKAASLQNVNRIRAERERAEGSPQEPSQSDIAKLQYNRAMSDAGKDYLASQAHRSPSADNRYDSVHAALHARINGDESQEQTPSKDYSHVEMEDELGFAPGTLKHFESYDETCEAIQAELSAVASRVGHQELSQAVALAPPEVSLHAVQEVDEWRSPTYGHSLDRTPLQKQRYQSLYNDAMRLVVALRKSNVPNGGIRECLRRCRLMSDGDYAPGTGHIPKVVSTSTYQSIHHALQENPSHFALKLKKKSTEQ